MTAKYLLVAVLLSAVLMVESRPEGKPEDKPEGKPEGEPKDEASNVIVEFQSQQTPVTTSSTKRPVTQPQVNGFGRLIDNVFQIPISVLRAVNTLLTDSFGRH